jgi:EpsD family peptidyl-prolyl cis-trans isomerase
MANNNILTGALVLSLLLLVACNRDEGPKVTGKTAAVVNGQPVSEEIIKTEMEKLGSVPSDQAQLIGNKLLKSAIDQELLSQEAIKKKLDQEPDVQMRLAAARKAVLAQAELESMVANIATPTAEEVKTYFDAHPELFAQRKAYRLVNLTVDASPAKAGKIRELLAKSTNLNDLVSALKAEGVAVSGQQVQKAAEEFPHEMLAKLNAMKNGQSLSFEQGGKLNLLVLQEASNAPVTLEQATQAINTYLVNESKRNKVEAGLNRIRSTAKIEYQPPYAAAE